MQNKTDVELMLEYQSGEALAMDELLARYKNPVYHFALRLSRNVAEAQDITQEVFLRVHRDRYFYRPTGKFSTWIFSIAHNLFISRMRKARWMVLWPRKSEDSDELIDVESPDPTPLETVANDDFNQVLKQCIQALPFLQREALVLREYQKLDYEEIARILHKPLGTIKTLIFRARSALKDKLLPYIKESKGGSHE